MQVLVRKMKKEGTNGYCEFLDGIPVETETPTLLTNRATLKSCLKASKELHNVEWDINDFYLEKVELIKKEKSKKEKFDFTEAEYNLSKKGYSVLKTETLQEMKELIPEEDYKMEFDA